MRARTLSLVALLAAAASGQTLSFSNQTAAAGLSNTYKPGASLLNPDYIAPCVCADFNNDGWQDLFLPSGGNSNGADKLYFNQGDGTFVNQAAAWGLSKSASQ